MTVTVGHVPVLLSLDHGDGFVCPQGPTMYRALCSCGQLRGTLCHEVITPRSEMQQHMRAARNGEL